MVRIKEDNTEICIENEGRFERRARVLCVIALILFGIGTLLVSFYWGSKYISNMAIPPDAMENPNIVKTVAHLDMSKHVDWKCVYEDVDGDTAYYEYTGGAQLPISGDTVLLRDGTKATVTYRDIEGFRMTSADAVFVAGMSGQVVQSESGKDLGIISELLPNGEVFCIWAW